MKVNYDRVADAVYIEMKPGKVHSTVEVSDIILHDLDNKGNVIGIELLNASSQLSPEVLENEVENGIPLSIIAETPR